MYRSLESRRPSRQLQLDGRELRHPNRVPIRGRVLDEQQPFSDIRDDGALLPDLRLWGQSRRPRDLAIRNEESNNAHCVEELKRHGAALSLANA